MNIAFLHQLMGTCYQLQSIYMTKIVSDLRTKHPSSSSGVNCPIFNIFRVGPHQITEGTFVRNLNSPVNSSNLVDSFDLRAKSTMHAEDLA